MVRFRPGMDYIIQATDEANRSTAKDFSAKWQKGLTWGVLVLNLKL